MLFTKQHKHYTRFGKILKLAIILSFNIYKLTFIGLIEYLKTLYCSCIFWLSLSEGGDRLIDLGGLGTQLLNILEADRPNCHECAAHYFH